MAQPGVGLLPAGFRGFDQAVDLRAGRGTLGLTHLLLGRAGRVAATYISIAEQLPADGRRGSGDQASNLAQAEPLGTADLNGGAFFNAEFGIRHRGSTVPEKSGVALSFCRRPDYLSLCI